VNLPEFLNAASDAWSLLAAYPLRWLAVVLVFLVAVECLMFIPYIGFVVKLAVASVLIAQVIAIFAAAAIGQSPNPAGMLSAFSMPIGTQVVLAGAALFPFFAGIAFLYLKGGPQAIEFFFGNILKTKPPSPAQFEQFKYVMQLVSLPFTFIAGAVVIKGLVGMDALSAAAVAAAANWLPVLILGVLALAFEWSSVQLPLIMPKWAAAIVGGVLLAVYLAWTFAITYSVSAKVFAPPALKTAASAIIRADLAQGAVRSRSIQTLASNHHALLSVPYRARLLVRR